MQELGRHLRDGVDAYLATLGEEDPLQETLGPLVDDWDEHQEAVMGWLRRTEDD